jgi:transketolase
MSKLTDEQRAQRQKHRAEQRKAAIQARWQTEISKAEQLIPEAKAYLEANPLSDRETWLLFAVVEDEARNARAGSSSAKAKWFDAIAPRARPTRWGGKTGVAGFCSKMVKDAFTNLVTHRVNGYIWAEPLGTAVVLYLRERFPVLRPDYSLENV